jgi:hypothetical protein
VADAPTLCELKGVMSAFSAKGGLVVSCGDFTKTARLEVHRIFAKSGW